MMWYLQLIALRNDMVKNAQGFEAAGNADAAADCWVDVAWYQTEIETRPQYDAKNDALPEYLQTLR